MTRAGSKLRTATRQPVPPEMNPGDEAVEGTPGTGEDACPVCRGRGVIGNQPCDNCGGTGKVVEGIGGG
jgi:RecJ-like exonuclease